MTAAWEPDFADGWHGWWQINGGAAAPGAPVHGVSRSTDKLDIFVIGTDSRVYTAAWEPDFADGWHGWWPLNGGVAAPGAPVTAVSRSADKLDIFVGRHRRRRLHGGVGAGLRRRLARLVADRRRRRRRRARRSRRVAQHRQARHLRHRHPRRRSTPRRGSPTSPTAGTAGGRSTAVAAAPGAAVTAVSRSTDKLDVFVVGTDGGVYTAAWEPDFADGWHGWWRIGDGVAPHGAPRPRRVAQHRQARHLRHRLDGAITTAAWEPDFADGWHGWWQINGGAAAPGPRSRGVAQRRPPRHLRVGTDGRVYTAAWEPDFADGWHGWWRMGS